MSKATSDESKMIWRSIAALGQAQRKGKDTAEIDFTYENTPGKTGKSVKVRSHFTPAETKG